MLEDQTAAGIAQGARLRLPLRGSPWATPAACVGPGRAVARGTTRRGRRPQGAPTAERGARDTALAGPERQPEARRPYPPRPARAKRTGKPCYLAKGAGGRARKWRGREGKSRRKEERASSTSCGSSSPYSLRCVRLGRSSQALDPLRKGVRHCGIPRKHAFPVEPEAYALPDFHGRSEPALKSWSLAVYSQGTTTENPGGSGYKRLTTLDQTTCVSRASNMN